MVEIAKLAMKALPGVVIVVLSIIIIALGAIGLEAYAEVKKTNPTFKEKTRNYDYLAACTTIGSVGLIGGVAHMAYSIYTATRPGASG